MRRAGNLWPAIANFENLLRATRRAARGKRSVAGVARFIERREPECLRLLEELEADTYRPGVPFAFEIRDPKRRTIHSAPFRDRVLHHALIGPLEPIFERRMIADSFACRRGKGTHAAIARARFFVRRYRWFLKLDIAQFFSSIPHDVVVETLERIVKDRRVLRLCETIVRETPLDAEGTRAGRGLPIGNLTSQWFANLALDRLDHHVKENLCMAGYVRYMDDFALFSGSKARLQHLHGELEAYASEVLSLRLKERGTVLAPVSQGLPFLGWRIYPGMARLRPKNLRRTEARLRHRRWQERRGTLTEDQLADATRSVHAHLRSSGASRALRDRISLANHRS